jgi:hypothetical protein
VHGGVAGSAQGNEVCFRIIAGSAAEFFVVNLKVRHHAAGLASPTIPAQHPVA